MDWVLCKSRTPVSIVEGVPPLCASVMSTRRLVPREHKALRSKNSRNSGTNFIVTVKKKKSFTAAHCNLDRAPELVVYCMRTVLVMLMLIAGAA